MKSSIVVRVRILCGVFTLLAALLIVRLYFVQIVHGAQYQATAMGQYVQADPESEDRGDIYFTTKDGQLVAAAVSESGYSIAIDPQTLQDPQKVYDQLDAITPIDKTAFMDAAAASSTYELVAQHLNASVGTPIQTLNIPGVILSSDEWRDYPGGDLAAEVLGYVGFQGTSTDETGIYGLEKYYNDTLSSPTSGLYVNPFAEIFTNVQDVVTSDPTSQHGSIITSIEPNVQQQLISTLQQVMTQYTPVFDGGIVMDPHTGQIIAMAQLPSFDPNDYNAAASDPSVYTNILVSNRYEMGSIMKPLTMAAGIDSGAITPQTTYDDTGCITVSGDRVCNFNYHAYGVIPMGTILDLSLNVGASWVATKTGYPTFTKYMDSYFDQKTGIDLPDEISADLTNLGNGTGPAVDYDNASFGQGIAVSAVQMIRALSALANGGVMPTPHIVTAIQYESGVTRQVPVAPGVQVFKASTAQQVTQMLETVYDNYELNGAIKMQHYTAAAKTGTAQIPDPAGGYYPGEYYIHSFFGYFPASNPRFIVFLYAYHPIGQEYSAYTWDEPYYQLEQYLINYYNIPPDR